MFIDTGFGYFNDLHKYASMPKLFFGKIHTIMNDKKFIPALISRNKSLEVAQRLSIEGILANGYGWIVPVIGVVIIGYKVKDNVQINEKTIIIDNTNKLEEYEQMSSMPYDIIHYKKDNQLRAIIKESAFDQLIPVVACYYVKTTMNPMHAFSLLTSAHDILGLTYDNIELLKKLYNSKNTFISLHEIVTEPPEIEQQIDIEPDFEKLIDISKNIDYKQLYENIKLKYLKAKKELNEIITE